MNAVISDDGYIFAIGSGSNNEYLSVLVDNEWKSIISKPNTPSKQYYCNLCIDSTIYSLGRWYSNGSKYLDTVETLDISSITRTDSSYNLLHSWTGLNFHLKYPRCNFAAVVLQCLIQIIVIL